MSYDYTYTGKRLETREVGVKALLRPQYDEVRWRRWSEWGDIFPDDSISRTAGRPRHAATAGGPMARPTCGRRGRGRWTRLPWGPTTSARSSSTSTKPRSWRPTARAIGVHADADVHFRPCLAENGVKMHMLTQCTLAPVVLNNGNRREGAVRRRVTSAGRQTINPSCRRANQSRE